MASHVPEEVSSFAKLVKTRHVHLDTRESLRPTWRSAVGVLAWPQQRVSRKPTQSWLASP